MMQEVLIIGSGPAAAGVALALAGRDDLQVTVLDLGLQLEDDHRQAVERLGSTEPDHWSHDELDLISAQPVDSSVRGLPEKRSYGSDFPFRNVGQLARITTQDGVNPSVISAAYGGFSNVWGSQVMPYTPATFDEWPISSRSMETHYRAILSELPFAAEEDDLAAQFPLIAPANSLPPLSERTTRVLSSYERHRHALNRMGLTLGRARLAFDSPNCIRCGLCMTGCPYSLIYSTTATFDRLRRTGRVKYRGGLMALSVGEDARSVFVRAKELSSGQVHRFDADRIFLACGAISTTRIVVNSLRLFNRELKLQESAQFALPFMSGRPTSDPRTEQQFTLNQFNVVIGFDERDRDISQLHFYTYNPAFPDALPRILRSPAARPVLGRLLRHLSVALGYLPSWESPALRLRARAPRVDGELPSLVLSRDEPGWWRNAMLRGVLSRLVRSGRYLDLWPVLPRFVISAGGKSYHWGGSFPHRSGAESVFSSDGLGRVGAWRRIHLVDASVFPNIAATTFTLTIMANAHRIATEAMRV